MKSASNLEAMLNAGHFVVTGEAGPPRGVNPDRVREKARLLKGYVDGVNITDNQTAMVRMSSIAAAKIVLEEGLDPVMQMVCRDRNRIAMQSDIIGANALGISNILCLTGDHQKFGDHPMAKNVFDMDSIQMVGMVKKMRDEGKFQSGEALDGAPRMYIGAVENPFGDPRKIRAVRLAKKAAAGADFIQTQCIYNLPAFEDWMQEVRDRGINEKINILAGVTPMKSFGMGKYMAEKVAGMDIPADVLKRMKGVEKGKARAEGIKICIETIQRLREIKGVRGVHIMAIEWEEAVSELVKGAGLYPRPAVSSN